MIEGKVASALVCSLPACVAHVCFLSVKSDPERGTAAQHPLPL